MGKIKYIHFIRGVAIFFIVAIHANLFINERNIYSNIYFSFLAEWTAVFIMISGFLFQHLLPKYQAKRYYVSKFKNVILPYLIVSFPAILIYIFGLKDSHNWVDVAELREHSIPYQIAFFYLTGSHLGPLWFIPTLCLIYLTAPLLKVIGDNNTLLWVVALISLIVIGLTHRPANDSNAFVSYLHFLPVYILGMFIYNQRDVLVENGRAIVRFYIYGVISIALLFASIKYGATIYIYQKLFLFLFLCVIFHLLEIKSKPGKFLFVLGVLADISFSVYFMHGYLAGYLRSIASRMNVSSWIYGIVLNLWFTIIFIIVIALISYVVKFLFKKKSRFIIGS